MSELVVFTGGFPYGSGETFLETEVTYLAQGFDKVHFVAVNPSNSIPRNLPDNCTAEGLLIPLGLMQKIAALRFFGSPLFWQERTIIHKVYKQRLSKGIIHTMLISLDRAQRVRKRAEKLITSKNPVFYSYWCDDTALGLAILSKKRKVLKTVCRIHRWDVYFEESAVGYLPYRHFISENISKIFSISHDGIDYAKRVWKTGKNDKFKLSRLGINNERPLKAVDRDYFLLVSCSNLIPVKRVHLIAEALLSAAEQRLKWVHIGDGPERTRIEKITKNLQKNIDIEFMGRIPNEAIYDYYDKHRPALFINISSSEGVPVSIMEAMSFGIPCIATDVGGNGEIVNDTNGILLSEHPTVQDIATAICTFFEPSKVKAKGDGAYLTWKERYNAEVNYSQFVQELKTKT